MAADGLVMVLRELVVEDAPNLHRIESATTDYPWSLSQFAGGLAGAEFGWGVEIEGELRAFALFSHVLDEATLLNISVESMWRRQGFASELLAFALPGLQKRGVSRCLLEVRVSNTPAIALYSGFGFVRDGVRPNYYPAPTGRESALLMSLALPCCKER